MQGGKQTGETLYGHEHMAGAEDVAHKTVFFHFTFYCRAYVHLPERILQADAKYYKKYVGGNGHEFYTDAHLEAWKNDDFRPPMRPDSDVPSLIAVMGPYTETEKDVPVYSDLRGLFSPEGDDANTAQFRAIEEETKSHYASAHFTNERWGFLSMSAMRYGAALLQAEPQYSANSLCVRGHHKRFTPDGKFGDLVADSGHHGKMNPVGRATVRNGSLELLAKSTAVRTA